MLQQEPNVRVWLLTANIGILWCHINEPAYARGHDSKEYIWYS